MEVCSEKLPYVYEAPAGAFISDKYTFLEISDMPILEKVCICLYFGIFQMTPTAAAATAARRQFFHLARPHPIACRNEISRSGIPHFDYCLKQIYSMFNHI